MLKWKIKEEESKKPSRFNFEELDEEEVFFRDISFESTKTISDTDLVI